MELKLKCEKIQNYLKKKLPQVRESKLLENEALLSAIYIPRINYIFNDHQKMIAKQNLKKKIDYRMLERKQVRHKNLCKSVFKPSKSFRACKYIK